MDNELQILLNTLKTANRPEDVFGILAGTQDQKLEKCHESFRYLVKLAHPDHFMDTSDKVLATEAFKLLNPMYEQAQAKIKAGTYGDMTSGKKEDPINIKTKRAEYILQELLWSGSIADIFKVTAEYAMKIVRSPANNELMRAEAKTLQAIRKEASGLDLLIPECIDSFMLDDPATHSVRQANILTYNPKLVSIEQVLKAYPNGIDPRDMVWMFKRSLAALWLAHERGYIHGAVLPPHILLNTENHGIVLCDWSFSVPVSASKLKAIDSKYRDYYPQSLLDKKQPTPASDIYMAAMTIIKLLGGDEKTKTIPDNVPGPLRRILRVCVMDQSGLDDAREVHEEVKSAAEKLYGAPKFREFALPK